MKDRKQALEWWKNLDHDTKYHWFAEYCNQYTRSLEQIYENEIEEIWIDNIKNKANVVYEFTYNGCVHESSWATMSLHYTKEGAEKAMSDHKQKKLDEFNKMYGHQNVFYFKFGEHEDWCVNPIEILQ